MKKEMILPTIWEKYIDILGTAFQPIVDINSGKLYGVEALLRNYRDIGFNSIFDVFDQVYKENIIHTFDMNLRKKALKKFSQIDNYKNIKLFYNLDNRTLDAPDYQFGMTQQILNDLNIERKNFVIEISERHEISSQFNMSMIMQHYKDEEYYTAIDDFGTGYSGYKLLYEATPNIIKIDRFFLAKIENDYKKKILVKNIIHLASQLGIKVLAEGVETKEELLTCQELGCNLAQGYFIQRPTQNISEIMQEYKKIVSVVKSNFRNTTEEQHTKNFVKKIEPLHVKDKITTALSKFKKDNKLSVLPVVNSSDEPVGLLEEKKIRNYLYSPYGMSLLLHDDYENIKIKNLLRTCGIIDINSSITEIIELFSCSPKATGVIVVKNSKYYGFMSSQSIISLMNEQNIFLAREQNPLTKLPGNSSIEKYIDEALKKDKPQLFCYFDLDNFKPFNDIYGFRNGDRVILLFADIIKKHLPVDYFKGHIGGDDFFVGVGIEKITQERYIQHIKTVIEKFSYEVKSFYNKNHREDEYITTKDREGNIKRFPLLTVSASIVTIENINSSININEINSILSSQKKVAKQDINHLAWSCLY